jgi:hypothetical protein
MKLHFAALLSVVHIHQGLKDSVGQWTRSNDVGAKHSGDKTCTSPKCNFPRNRRFPQLV